MKKILLVLLLSIGFVQAQDKERTVMVNEVLKPYVNNFVEVLTDDGWEIAEMLKDQDISIVFDTDIKKDLDEDFDGAGGIALGMNEDIVLVVINIDGWVTLDEWEKQDLINHELMHDIFDVKHTEVEDEDRLMHPSSYPEDWGDTMSRLFRAINDLNEANGY